MSSPVKSFDSVAFFRTVKQTLSEKMKGMSLAEQQAFLKQINQGKIKIVFEQK